MSRVLGDLIQEGCVAKLADDLYVGGKSPIEVLDNWRRVLASKRTIFAYQRPKLSSAQERPSYWAGCGLMALCKLAPTNWPHYPQSSLPQQYKASAPLSELTRFSAMCFQDLRSCLTPWTKPLQGKNPEKKLCGAMNYC